MEEYIIKGLNILYLFLNEIKPEDFHIYNEAFCYIQSFDLDIKDCLFFQNTELILTDYNFISNKNMYPKNIHEVLNKEFEKSIFLTFQKKANRGYSVHFKNGLDDIKYFEDLFDFVYNYNNEIYSSKMRNVYEDNYDYLMYSRLPEEVISVVKLINDKDIEDSYFDLCYLSKYLKKFYKTFKKYNREDIKDVKELVKLISEIKELLLKMDNDIYSHVDILSVLINSGEEKTANDLNFLGVERIEQLKKYIKEIINTEEKIKAIIDKRNRRNDVQKET